MTATATAPMPVFGEQAPNFEPHISLETFLEKYRKGGEDGMKWEWKNGIDELPLFVIEVISKKDKINIVVNKVDEYFAAGVQVIWHIFPEQKMVHIYKSLDTIEVCRGEKICSAAPVLLDFDREVSDIFKI
jgi:Uma2 family endonuclease